MYACPKNRLTEETISQRDLIYYIQVCSRVSKLVYFIVIHIKVVKNTWNNLN